MSCQLIVVMAGITSARRAGRSPCDDPHRWVTAVRCAGTDAEAGGGDVKPELPALQLAGDGPAVGCDLPELLGHLALQPAPSKRRSRSRASISIMVLAVSPLPALDIPITTIRVERSLTGTRLDAFLDRFQTEPQAVDLARLHS